MKTAIVMAALKWPPVIPPQHKAAVIIYIPITFAFKGDSVVADQLIAIISPAVPNAS